MDTVENVCIVGFNGTVFIVQLAQFSWYSWHSCHSTVGRVGTISPFGMRCRVGEASSNGSGGATDIVGTVRI